MPVAYAIVCEVRPGNGETFLQLLIGVLDAMREEPMFHEAVLHCEPASENRFTLYDTWESHEDVLAVQLARALSPGLAGGVGRPAGRAA